MNKNIEREDKKASRVKFGHIQQKLLIALLGGLAFGLSQSPKRQFKLLTKDLPAEFAKVNMQSLEYGLHRLYKSKHIGIERLGPGRYAPYLTKEGQGLAMDFNIDEIKINIPKTWDKKWRIVSFDIPEKFKKRRNAFRYHLSSLGFREIQKSIFCFPYECGEKVMKIARHIKVTPFIVYMVADELSISVRMKGYFNL